MKALKRDLESLAKNLRALTQKTKKIAAQVDKLEKSLAAQKKSKAKVKVKAKPAAKKTAGKAAVKKGTKVTAIDSVFSIIKKTKRGVDTAAIRSKTGFNERKIWNIINIISRTRFTPGILPLFSD